MKIVLLQISLPQDYYDSSEFSKFIDWTDKKDISDEEMKYLESYVQHKNSLKNSYYKYVIVKELCTEEILADVKIIVSEEKERLEQEKIRIKDTITLAEKQAQTKLIAKKEKLLAELEELDKKLSL